MKVTNLSSGSKGNCTLVQGSVNILVDIGLGYKTLCGLLLQVNQPADAIDGILITHEHSDHISGLESFLKKHPHVHVYAHELVWKEITKKFTNLANYPFVHLFSYNVAFSVGDFSVLAMENFHDSVTCASFIISKKQGGKLGICTDLGIITTNQIEMLKTCKVVYLECNHDEAMLQSCNYPQILKSRIKGKYGHLSNGQCASTAVELCKGQTRVLVLSHISQNSNLPEVAYSRVMQQLSDANSKLMVLVAYQTKVSKTITIV